VFGGGYVNTEKVHYCLNISVRKVQIKLNSPTQKGPTKSMNFHDKIPNFSPKKGSHDQALKEPLILELESTTGKFTHNIKDPSFSQAYLAITGVNGYKP